MFHKENSSVETKHSSSNNENTSKKNTRNNNNSATKKKGSSATTTTKVKDVPLRKSDRRELLRRAIRFFNINTIIEDENGEHLVDNNRNTDINDNSPSNNKNDKTDLNKVPGQDTDNINNNKNISKQDHYINDNDRMIISTLEHAFLHGILYSRQVKLPDCKVTLYCRSPADEEELDSIINNNRDKNSDESTASALVRCWPYRRSNQCIWIFVDQGASIDDQYNVPGLALLSVLMPVFMARISSSDNNNSNDHDQLRLPIVQVHPHVSSYLVRGANLMKAGMRTIPSFDHQRCNTSNNHQNVVFICIQGNVQPFAVGLLHPSIRSISDIGSGTNGIGVTIISCYGDDIWKHQHPYSPGSNHNKTASNTTTTMTTSGMIIQSTNNNKKGGNVFINPIGGAPYDDGHYGNVGFVDGKLVVPITTPSSSNSSSSTVEPILLVEDHDPMDDSQQLQHKDEKRNETPIANDGSDNAVNQQRIDAVVDENETIIDGTYVDENNNTIDTATNAETIVIGDGSQSKINDAEQPDHEEEEQVLSQDMILHISVLRGLTKLLPNKKQVLPMTVANFYANYVLPNRPINTTIQLKQTKYKKFGNYVAEHCRKYNDSTNDDSDEKLLLVGPQHGGGGGKAGNNDPMAMLLDFNNRHPDLRSYMQQNKHEYEDSNNDPAMVASGGGRKLILLDLYVIPHHFVSLLRLDPNAVKASNASSEERKNTGLLTSKEMKDILDTYIEREALVQPDYQVQLDGPLTDALYGKKKKKVNDTTVISPDDTTSPPPERMPRKDLAALWRTKMEPAYALVTEATSNGSNLILKLGKGKPPTVLIDIGRGKKSNSYVTRIRGVELYGISTSILAHDIAVRFACSATVDENPVANGRPALKQGEYGEIIVQGNWGDELEALLLSDETLTDHGGVRGSEYRLPKNSIEIVLRKGVPQRKKKQSKPTKTIIKK